MTLKTLIKNTDLSVRIKNNLKNESVLTIGQLVELEEDFLNRIPNMGEKSVLEIKKFLEKLGLSLGMKSPIPTDLSISAYLHCRKCLESRPKDQSPREWAQLEIGYTDVGFQVWCKRHECNVMHVDFEGQQHPANLHTTEDFSAPDDNN